MAAIELDCDAVTISGAPIRDSLVRGMADDLERFQEHARAAIIALRGNGGGVLTRPVRRKRELTDDFLRDVVRRHAAHQAAGDPPTATLAAEEGVTPSAVKGWLRRARERGIKGDETDARLDLQARPALVGPDRARPDPITGKRRREWHHGFKTKREAEDARVEILADLQRGEHVSPDKVTVRAFLEDEWLPAMGPSLRPSTLRATSSTCDGWSSGSASGGCSRLRRRC